MTVTMDGRVPVIRLLGDIPPEQMRTGLQQALAERTLRAGRPTVLDVTRAAIHADFGTALRLRDAVFESEALCAIPWHVVPGTEVNTALVRRLVMLFEGRVDLRVHTDLTEAVQACRAQLGGPPKPAGRSGGFDVLTGGG